MTISWYPADHIESFNLMVNGKIEVIKSQIARIYTSDLVYRPNGQIQEPPKRVWKEIYIAKDGIIILEKTIEGKVIPAQDERWEFPE